VQNICNFDGLLKKKSCSISLSSPTTFSKLCHLYTNIYIKNIFIFLNFCIYIFVILSNILYSSVLLNIGNPASFKVFK
jgi:hypothetical protein